MVVTAKDLMEWLRERVVCPHWSCGKADMTQERTICVYAGRSPAAAVLNVAGSRGSYAVRMLRVWVRWTGNYTAAREKAEEVYRLLRQRRAEIGGRMCHIIPVYDEPVDVGTAEDGVYENAIEIKVICER